MVIKIRNKIIIILLLTFVAVSFLQIFFVLYNIFGKNFYWNDIFDFIISPYSIILFEIYSVALFFYFFLKRHEKIIWIVPLVDILGFFTFTIIYAVMFSSNSSKVRYFLLVSAYVARYLTKMSSIVVGFKVLGKNKILIKKSSHNKNFP